MAVLADDELRLEVSYKDFMYGWVSYHVVCTWRGMPIFDDRPLKRHNDYWASRRANGFLANADGVCALIPFVNAVLETKMPDRLELIEPDMTWALSGLFSSSRFNRRNTGSSTKPITSKRNANTATLHAPRQAACWTTIPSR